MQEYECMVDNKNLQDVEVHPHMLQGRYLEGSSTNIFAKYMKPSSS